MNTLNFPKRYKLIGSGVVVEFVGLREGTVAVANNYWDVGYTSKAWGKCTNSAAWTPIELPTINLKDIV